MERLEEFPEDARIKVHYYTCLILTKQFESKERLEQLKISKKSVMALALSKYMDNTELSQ